MSELQLIRPLYQQGSVMKELTIASLQTAMSFLLEYLPNTISIYLLEFKEDSVLVGALGLGILTTQAFGMGILNGLATGLETLVSQAYGANHYELCAKLYYRSLFLCTLFMIPISLFLIFSTQIISFINNNTELAEETGNFNRYMILAVYLNAIFVNTKVFLNGQNIYKYQFYTQLVTCILFVGISYLLIVRLELGIVGCALSLTSLDLLNNIILFSFIFVTKCSQATLYKFKLIYLKNTIKFLKEAIPIGSILWLEWISFDFYVILVSYLNTSTISAHVLMSNFAGFLYQFSYGISIASTTFVGNEMGRKKVDMAKKYTKATFLIDGIFLLIILGLFSIFGKTVIDYLSEDKIVVEQIYNSMYLLVAFIILDGLQAIISGLVRAIGREASASITFILCYLVMGEIIGYLLCYTAEIGLKGVWIGIVIGAIAYDIIQLVNLLWKDWNVLAENIVDKLMMLHQQQNVILQDDDI
ncbi:unnamed protein product [Paramecium pentaurelia]|uniref:MATE efflux family protein n=1 Tax=Paramecium pentaurelia TaxID=43138 RepID=A0A8S1WTH1_9CILI|nr:unnamed protein product [Paramecium pentaurelia]